MCKMYITGVIITIHMHIYIFYVSSAANSECNNKLASFHFVSAAVVPSVNFAGFIGPDQIYVICRNYSSNFSFSTLQHTHMQPILPSQTIRHIRQISTLCRGLVNCFAQKYSEEFYSWHSK